MDNLPDSILLELPPHCGLELVDLIAVLVEVRYDANFDDLEYAAKMDVLVRELGSIAVDRLKAA
jgi:hypothetical protein